MENKFTTKSFSETQKLGQNLARQILASGRGNSAMVVCLQGDLGAGKTTFLQGFAKGLGIKDVVNSPTFVIMKKFEIVNSSFNFFYHLDLYRLENEQDLQFLDFKEIISNPQNIVAIEWPERIKNILPKDAIFIEFKYLEEHTRGITIGLANKKKPH